MKGCDEVNVLLFVHCLNQKNAMPKKMNLLSYHRQEPGFDRQVDHSTDKGLGIFHGRILQNFQSIPTVFASPSQAVRRHKFPVLHDVVNVMFIVNLFMVVVGVLNIVQIDLINLLDNAKPTSA